MDAMIAGPNDWYVLEYADGLSPPKFRSKKHNILQYNAQFRINDWIQNEYGNCEHNSWRSESY